MFDSKAMPPSLRMQITVPICICLISILLVNFLIFYSVLHYVEDSVSIRRAEFLQSFALDRYRSGAKGPQVLDHLTTAYDRYESIPKHVTKYFDKNWRGGEDFDDVANGDSVFTVLAKEEIINGERKTLYIVENSTPVTMTLSMKITLTLGVVLSSLLILISFYLIVRRLSENVSRPFNDLARLIDQGSTDDLLPLSEKGLHSQEQLRLVQALNDYRRRIHLSIEREKSFSRYVSHELRTPLSVIMGVAGLLEISNAPAFVEKQRLRLERACRDMTDISETLLSLVREQKASIQASSMIDRPFIEQLVEENKTLLQGKPVAISIDAGEELVLNAPDTMIRILLGNIIKNAFSYTQEGEVSIHLTDSSLEVLDTGPGLKETAGNLEGHGLGLMIVNDICRQNGWSFTLQDRVSGSGCQALLVFSKGHQS
ncbi:HAMP domain-containing sensor histidine kinase [Endozoicomonas sp. 4G]|uniref:sensor histidine kinase n=1 Tax=Endozoicomonas sp. 4G TaxID=2872754 RepID=UPI002078DD5D|nr:HAMP domain-containing sensor histidine kinase [Endozoicomonas sp. 4G]